ncbi:MAG: hypothetical protein JSU75_08850 [Gammaproteobacteria bacterium]|nr:MAG: hypothetical protein JSU75_08850 [Gammaproteobacteria bacterium]
MMVVGDKSGIDLAESRPSLDAQLKEHKQHLAALPEGCEPVDRARVQVDIAETLLALQRKEESWSIAREAFDNFANAESWQDAIEACDILFQCEQPESLAALGNGVWLAITYPVPAQLTVAMLQHIVDETPDDSDGAAVAAMAANYIAELRTEGHEQESLTFFTRQILAGVAKRHRGIEDDPDMIKMWIEILGLNDVQELLSRLAEVINTITGDNWWIDRDALREKLPVN